MFVGRAPLPKWAHGAATCAKQPDVGFNEQSLTGKPNQNQLQYSPVAPSPQVLELLIGTADSAFW
jgi:hypothetical protein